MQNYLTVYINQVIIAKFLLFYNIKVFFKISLMFSFNNYIKIIKTFAYPGQKGYSIKMKFFSIFTEV